MNPDRPILTAQADRLHRAPFAKALADELASIPSGPGRVFALVGPWGAGKSSVLEMVREELKAAETGPIVTDVNPWLFSGTDQLVQLFIAELASRLSARTDKQAAEAAKLLTDYAATLSELSWVPAATRVAGLMRLGANLIGRQAKMHGGSLEGRRKAIGAALKESKVRLLVIVDDIDRLTDAEIRDVVRTVRLVGDFDNVTYLLAFDRRRVEKALESPHDPGSGRDYLEKIVQTVHPLPEARFDDLSQILSEEINRAVGDLTHGPFDLYDWQNIGSLTVRPLIRTVRDVYRFTNVIPGALRTTGEEVALQDVLALEAVRVLLPDVWDALLNAVPALGYTRDAGLASARAVEDGLRLLVERVLSVAGDHEQEVRQLLQRVFPASGRFIGGSSYASDFLGRWQRERRVAHPTVMSIYLERTLNPTAVPATTMDALYAGLTDEAALEQLLESLSPSQLEEALARLEGWEDEFPPPNAGAIAHFLALRARLREGRRGMFDFGADLAVDRVVLRILRRSEDPAERLRIVETVLRRYRPTLSGALSLILLVGHEQGAGHELIPKEDADRLGADLAGRIARAQPDELRAERDLPKLLYWLRSKGGDVASHALTELLQDDFLLAQLIRKSVSETSSQQIGDVAERRSPTLPWDELQTLLPAGELGARVNGLRPRLGDSIDEVTREALALAERYAGGWRPRGRFGDEQDEPTA